METRTAFSSAVMGVPAYAVGNKIKDIYAIKDYAISNVITCCVLETAVPSTKVGCARRCTLNLKRFDEALLREKLIATHEDDVLTTVSLEYIPCGADELHRSPFGVEGTKRLKRAVTTYRVSQVSQSLNRCYVEIKTELEVAPNPRGDEMEEKHIIAAITYFWQTFVDHLLRSLEAYVLSQAYPVLSTRMDTEFRKTYEAEEEVFCQWTASSKPHFPREEVLSHYEQCLTCWVKVLQEYRHQKMIAEAVKADADGSKRIAAETAKLLAESQAAVEAMRRLQEARDAEPPCLYRNANDTSATSASNPRLEESHNRRRYQKYATTDPINSLNAEHHEVLSMDEQRIVDESNEQARKVEAAMAQAPKHRPPPLHYHPALLQKLFTPAGSLNEPEADIIFRSLDQRERTFVTSEELTRVLVSMDHHGLYEDVDGTMEQLEEYRRAIKRNFKERAFHLSDEDEIQAPSSAAEGGEVAKSGPSSAAPRAMNAMERAIARHDAKRLELRENAMRKVAEDTIHRFAFRESEKLFFDEFCLAIMHLLKG